jgi:hypothetical protein
MTEIPEIQDVSMAIYKNAARKFYFAVPLYLVVPVGFWLAFRFAGVPMKWTAFGIGAAGWILALMLRGPIAALVSSTCSCTDVPSSSTRLVPIRIHQ